MNLSKSKYTQGVTCKKKLWLSCYKPELSEASNDVVLENGNRVGDLARNLFGEYVLINQEDGYQQMIEQTKKELKQKPNIICEASFSYDGNFCSVDILKNDLDGVEIYEVKSSTKMNDIYLDDISYQTWVLKQCEILVKKSFLVYVNGDYVKNGDFDLHQYFHIEDVTNLLKLDEVPKRVLEYKQVIHSSEEPIIDLSLSCHKPYDCPFFKYCTKDLPTPNVFDIGWNTHFDKKIELYNSNHVSFEDIIHVDDINPKAYTQICFELFNENPKINKPAIKSLLDTLKYPLYFLDFESYQDSIPSIDGTKPYQQICFQYSLHYYLEPGGELFHKDYLSEDYDGNPMYGLCCKLCEDIPMNSCVLVYNQAFEKARLLEMAELFVDLREHLLNIRDHIVDLLPPFKNQDYYVKEMGGSASIKKVLPALFPNDSSLDYHNLSQVHKGDEASNAYLSLKKLKPEEQKELRFNMLKYCELDTYAMVKIFEKMKEVIS